jgi:penicillin-binding protein 1B
VPKGRAHRGGRSRFVRRAALVGLLLAGVALALDVSLLSEAVEQRMEGRVHDEPARMTGFVPRLAPGEFAKAEGWRSTLVMLGYTEVQSPGAVGRGEFHLGRRNWLIHPKDGDPTLVRLVQGKVKWLKSSTSGLKLPAADFPLPAISVLTGSSRERRSVVRIGDIPVSLIRATVTIEDERFYRHHGLDPRGIARAALANFTARGISQGGSTITQQLAKNMFLRADRTLRRKFQEALLSLILEQRYEKDEILEAYLNEIYLGQRDGYAIMGVGEAARVWFGKGISGLSAAESALLAGAIHSPNRTVPWKHPEEALRRRNQVLEKMHRLDALSPQALSAALAEPLPSEPGDRLQRRAPWFVDAAVAELSDRYTTEALHREGLELVTTLDLRMQTAAEAAVASGMDTLRLQHPELWQEGRSPQVALVALAPMTGAVRALVGGHDYRLSQFNRVTQARRQPGSAFKPIVLAAAIGERWPKLGPRSLVRDTALEVPSAQPQRRAWTPKNYDSRFLGRITLREATQRSRNLPFVRLALDVGIDRVRSAAEAMGITSPIPSVPSIAIGSAEVSPLELAVVYATLANGGLRPKPHYLVGVQSRAGEWLERELPSSTAAIDPRVAAVVTDLLEGVIDSGTARSAREAGLRIPLAGKTGTSNEARDAWMAGYSTDLSVVVWVGFDRSEPLGLPSTAAALPIWIDFMKRVEPHLSGQRFEIPLGTGAVLAAGGQRLDPERRLDLEDEDRSRRSSEADEMRRQQP